MKLPLSWALGLFLIGALVAPFGDHGHVVTGTTRYLKPDELFFGDSAWWFVLMVAMGTAGTAELRVRLAPTRSGIRLRYGLAGIAAVMGIYALTALLRGQPLGPTTLLIAALALLSWCVLGDWPAALCGVITAMAGAGIEITLSAAGLFRYAEGIDVLFGIPYWLPFLYFSFGVSAAVLGEIAMRAAKNT